MKTSLFALFFAFVCQNVLAGDTVTLKKISIQSGDIEVPAEIATPKGNGPFPPVLYIHAKRGYDEVDQRHITTLAEQGFLVLAPDWQSGRFIERWPSAHNPATEDDVEAALNTLQKLPDACKIPVGYVGYSRGGYYSIRLAAKRGKDIAAIANYAGHMQNPNAPEPEQLFSVAPEIAQITTPMLFLIGEQDYELRRMNGGRAFYALYERGVPVEMQYYPLARRAFDFRNDQSPEEKIATKHARERVKAWLLKYMKVDKNGKCS
ncbi:dienelactone hydrolase family protein [Sulfurirhabdus autotrophica]|uniref:Carboxymethylenebutenolidase n=1 Tax=Sulfurirhabdus autotrophica TaxID=1706046 RepID=A0A4R3XZ88_9PROT|nr:dienelactone hydrolase family protein [Sulfurirhabdus autotrophica]TCV84686.1 carboxymethylenebutenolidase [Sulfurirhabdus autotrophica]